LVDTPLVGGQSASQRSVITNTINQYNSALTSRLATFKSSNSGVNIAVVVDTSVAFSTATSNPSAYGAPNASCQNSNGKSCLWWDQLHPGASIQKLFAQSVATALKGTFF
jgi:phospholipase/lecithinase/hemolysin